MSRLQEELARLFGADAMAPDDGPRPLADARGGTRALVLELGRPADWEPVAEVWRGVQVELGLPAPAIAVSGTDAMQLWFALREPVPLEQARDFLRGLCRRYLDGVAASRWRLWPAPAGPSADPQALEAAPRVPALQPASGHWSAFVAPDLAPLFAESPWLELPPGEEGQAQLLAGLATIAPADFAAALDRLAAASPAAATAAPAPFAEPGAAADAPAMAPAATDDPAAFLRAVMNDAGAPLALRVEAAKALLAAGRGPRGRAD